MKIRVLTLIATLILILVAVALQSTPNPLFAGQPPSNGAVPLTTIEVNSTADVIANDGQCTLREAITAANADTASGTMAGECGAGIGDDVIMVPDGVYRLSLTGANEDNNQSGDLDIRSNLTIQGMGAQRTIFDGNGSDRVIDVATNFFNMKDLTITNGALPSEGNANGGGIFIDGGFVEIRRVSIRNNRAGDATGTRAAGNGGGLWMQGEELRLDWSEVSENQAGFGSTNQTSGNGGGIYIIGEGYARARFGVSTISNNRTDTGTRGAGIYATTVTANIYYITLAQNKIGNGNSGVGGGLYLKQATANLYGALIADNYAEHSPDCFGSPTSNGNNLIGNVTECFFTPLGTDQVNIDPLLGELGDNGGETRTHALYDSSPAIDKGGCGYASDQRGFQRPIDIPLVPNGYRPCDVGAFEAQGTLHNTPTVIQPSPTPRGSTTPTPTPDPYLFIYVNSPIDTVFDEGRCTLREAITSANTDTASGTMPGECRAGIEEDVIIIPPGVFLLSRVGYEDNNIIGDLDIRAPVTLQGAGVEETFIDGNLTDRVLQIWTSRVTMQDLSIVRGQTTGHGGGLDFSTGTEFSEVTLRRVHLRGNTAGGHGGGIYVSGSPSNQINLEDVTVWFNSSGDNGGGIYMNNVSARIEDSRFSDNIVANNGGGIFLQNGEGELERVIVRSNRTNNADGRGAGIYVENSTLAVGASEISENLLGKYGAGIFMRNSSVSMLLSTISGNLVLDKGSGSGIFTESGTLALSQMTIVRNKVGSGLTGSGAGIRVVANGNVTLKGSIVAENIAATAIDCTGPITSQGGNLIGNLSGCTFTPTAGDQVNIAAEIDDLRDNGGPGTRTHALFATSPALDYGNCDTGTTDQRGFPRPVDLPTIPNGETACDVGAFEAQELLIGSPTPTVSPTVTVSRTPTLVPTSTWSPTPSILPSATATHTPVPTFTATPTPSITPTPGVSIQVNSAADILSNDGQCTLREAITAANTNTASGGLPGECVAGTGDDLILIPAGQYVLTRTGALEDNNGTGDLDILESVVLRGAGANQTWINGNGTDRVLQATASRVIVEGVTIMNGRTPTGGFANGGGIAYLGAPNGAVGTFTLRWVAVRDNHTADAQGLWNGGDGGGIYVDDALFTLEYSEVSENGVGNGTDKVQRAGYGGGIYAGTLAEGSVLRLSTISGNTVAAGGFGGGTYISDSRILLSQVTIANNDSGAQTFGRGIFLSGSVVTLQGTLIANSSCFGPFMSAFGNLIDEYPQPFVPLCDFTATSKDQTNINPQIATLANNGGPTRTHMLIGYSPAMDRGSCDASAIDQRNLPRRIDLPEVPNGNDVCDVGALEVQIFLTLTPTPTHTPTVTPTRTPFPPASILINSTLDIVADDGLCTLREAITSINVNLQSGVTPGECAPPASPIILHIPAGTYRLTLTGAGENDNATGDLDLRRWGTTLRGDGAQQTIIDGNQSDRVLDLVENIVIEDLTITNGYAPTGEPGGGIRHISLPYPLDGVSLVLRRVAVRNNHAGDGTASVRGGDGGGVYVSDDFPRGYTIEYSEISGNHAGRGDDTPGAPGPGDGGGVWMHGTIVSYSRPIVRWSTISGNHVDEGGRGAGLFSAISGYYTLFGMTITDNWVGDGTSGSGGGLYTTYTVFLRGNLVADNHALTGPDCTGIILTNGGNLIRNPQDCLSEPHQYDQFNVDPRLGPLQYNGGYGAHTHHPLDDSPAIDKGWCMGETTDQRGFARPVNIPDIPDGVSSCDVGAVEYQGEEPTPTPTATATYSPTPTITVTPSATSIPQAQRLYLPLIQR